MKELESLEEWAASVLGEYGAISEGFDAKNPVTGKISSDEIARFRSNKPIGGSTQHKPKGPPPEIREKLRQLRAEFADKAGIAEADIPPQGSMFSPLSAVTRDRPAPDPRAALKRKRAEASMQRFMGRST